MVDILAIGAHPDDIEIFMGGAIAALVRNGKKVGICDLTKGEAGTYGSSEERMVEAARAAELIGIQQRETLSFPDSMLENNREIRHVLIDVIRRFKPKVVFSFTTEDLRHPDHQVCGELVKNCCYLSGLEKIETEETPFRPEMIYQFPELIMHKSPDLVIDITDYWELKVQSIETYSTQILKQGDMDNESKTFIRSPQFWNVLESRCRQAGALIGVEFGEPFYAPGTVAVTSQLEVF